MSDNVKREGIQGGRRAGSSELREEFPDKFPFEAFEVVPGETENTLKVAANWNFETNTLVSAKGIGQTGEVAAFAMNAAPDGWLKCNGAAIPRATYSALFTAIGTIFGAGDGSTTFTLPDLRGEFVRGWVDDKIVQDQTGRAFGNAELDQMQMLEGSWINVTTSRCVVGSTTGVFKKQGTANDYAERGTSSGGKIEAYFNSNLSANSRVSSTTAGETRGRNVALLYCIKY